MAYVIQWTWAGVLQLHGIRAFLPGREAQDLCPGLPSPFKCTCFHQLGAKLGHRELCQWLPRPPSLVFAFHSIPFEIHVLAHPSKVLSTLGISQKWNLASSTLLEFTTIVLLSLIPRKEVPKENCTLILLNQGLTNYETYQRPKSSQKPIYLWLVSKFF